MSIRRIAFIIIIVLALTVIGCTKDDARDVEDEILRTATGEAEGQEDEVASPISGIYASRDRVERRPMAIMLDNHPKARWQAGLSQAEVVYEYLVEGGYTRYMAIFLINDPESIGPIRSARPYFITSALEYDSIYVRVGGSPQAKDDMRVVGMDDIDGMVVPSSVLWKTNETGKVSPHNTYTSMEVLRAYQAEKGYSDRGDFSGFKFNEEDEDLDGMVAKNVLIDYNRDNTSRYIYDEDERVYSYSKDGEPYRDELDDAPVKVKNIIIQEADIRMVDDDGRLFIDLIGEGKGKYITNGKSMDLSWIKKSRSNRTHYYDEDGREIALNPGITWIQVVKPGTNIDIGD
ncbi:MAG: DUF3048 domain-containing protein [Tissierellia bacterium]|nr:DUF3048 domain-containing protein [Tissierellia bacterium]